MCLDFDFSTQLVFYSCFQQLTFEQHLSVLRPRRKRFRRTFRATMYFVLFSLAMKTFPNFPFPKGFPISKSASCTM